MELHSILQYSIQDKENGVTNVPGQQPDDRTNSNKEIGFSLSYPFLYLVLLVYYLLSSYLPN
ncbi:hypothetical protein M115_3107 [Bacteroides fragilis str. 3719 T6]|nr:hypothetical protein M115_3107 [Bacteroides fragilis str. 3719 T6]